MCCALSRCYINIFNCELEERFGLPMYWAVAITEGNGSSYVH